MYIRRHSPGLTLDVGVSECFMHIGLGPGGKGAGLSPHSFLLPAVLSSPPHGLSLLSQLPAVPQGLGAFLGHLWVL